MTTDAWTTRSAEPFAFHWHAGSYADENVDSIVGRYQKALDDVCLFLDIQKHSLSTIAVYLCEVLPDDSDGVSSPTLTHLDLENAALWTVVTSESAGAYPEFELTQLALRLAQGPARPEARFWEEGLAGYLAGRGGASYYSEAPERAQRLRDEGQLRSLVNTVRQYADHRSPVAATVAVAFVTFLIEWRGGERYRRFLARVRSRGAGAAPPAYRRPPSPPGRGRERPAEADAPARGGKGLTPPKGKN